MEFSHTTTAPQLNTTKGLDNIAMPYQSTTSSEQQALPPLTPEQQALVAENMDLAHRIASRLVQRWPRQDYDDLLADGFEGLCQAARSFDPQNETGAQFSTFANQRVAGAIIDAARAFDRVNRRTGQSHAISTMKGQNAVPLIYGEDTTEEYGIPASSVAGPDTVEADVVDSLFVGHLFNTAQDEREREIMRGIAADKTLREIGIGLGITESRVSQLLSQIRQRVRRAEQVEN